MKHYELRNWILNDVGKRTDLTSDASAAITNAIRHYQRERFYFLETITAITTTASVATYPVPSDFIGNIDTVMVTISGRRQPMMRIDHEEIEENDDGALTSQPTQYTVYANNIRVYPIPDKTYVLRMSYQMKLDPPTDSGSNAWTNAAADLIRSRATADMWLNTLRNPQQAMAIREQEMIAYHSTIGETTRRISTGKLRKSGF